MIDLRVEDASVVVPVKARAGGKRNGIDGVHAGALRIVVTAAPEKGKANEAIRAVLAEHLGIPRQAVELVRGVTSTQKAFRVEGLALEEVRQRLLSHIGEAS